MGKGVGTTQLAPGPWGNPPKHFLSPDMITGRRQLCEHTCACCIVSARIAVVVMLLSCHGAVHDFVQTYTMVEPLCIAAAFSRLCKAV